MSKYHDLKYDSNVKQFQYLPYLYNITPEYIDEFNKNILKNKFGYYIDENNPKNYLQDKNRYINDNDRMLNYRRKYNENHILYETLTAEFYNMILYYNKLKDSNKQNIYEGYLYKIQTHIHLENKRIFGIINEIDRILINDPNRIVGKNNKMNINILLLILLITFITYIFIYNYTY